MKEVNCMMFGNYTPQPTTANSNGFIALAVYDDLLAGGNGNGLMDSGDLIFAALHLWQDLNHNGAAESVELKSLAQHGLTHLELDYRESRRQDRHGNWFRYRAKARDAQGAQIGRWAWGVFLRQQ
jgi:hypothetical protein